MAAFSAVPSSVVTPTRISATFRAVWVEITLFTTLGFVFSVVIPDSSTIFETTYGRISFPPFAMAAMAIVNCKDVPVIPCPKKSVA